MFRNGFGCMSIFLYIPKPKPFRILQNALAVSSAETAFLIFPGKEEALLQCFLALGELNLPIRLLVWDKGSRYSPGGGNRLNYSTEMIVLTWSVREKVIAFSAIFF